MTKSCLLHSIAGPPGTRLEHLLREDLQPVGRFRPLVGAFGRVIDSVSGPPDLIEGANEGLPANAARGEATAIRLRRRGIGLEWGEPRIVGTIEQALSLCYERGRSSLELARADPSLTTELQLGDWFSSDWRIRAFRRLCLVMRPPHRKASTMTAHAFRLAADLEFWRGVRADASPAEWQRLASSSYVALVYHRLAGERKPGQERVDLAPDAFDRQLRLLRFAGFRQLPVDELLTFHNRSDAVLPRRRFVVTVDDALADCRMPLRRHAREGVHLYVPTGEVGGAAYWLDGEPVMSWSEIRSLAEAGVAIGAHARLHHRLSGLTESELVDQLDGSLHDLKQNLDTTLEVLAYPYGDHDLACREAARIAGFQAAFTTEKGRNGAGTDRYCLRRVSVHAADGSLEVLWKVLTGEALPRSWERVQRFRSTLGDHLRGAILNNDWSRPGSSHRS